MRIVIAGSGSLAVRGAQLFAMLAQLADDDTGIACVPLWTDTGEGRWRPSLRETARRNRWPVHETVAKAGLGSADLFLSLQYDQVVPLRDLNGARAVNLHFSPLPRHRGSLSCYWPIACRDAVAGVTLHELTARVDTGPIIANRLFTLPDFVTAAELYRMCHAYAFDLLATEARALLAGTYEAREQPAVTEPAHRRRDVDFCDVEVRDFARSAAEVRDSYLALAFPEFQLPTFRGRPVCNAYVVPGTSVDAGPGQPVAASAHAVLVQCADGVVCLEYAEMPSAQCSGPPTAPAIW